MSDTGGVELGEVDVVIGADVSQAQAQANGLFQNIVSMGNSMLPRAQSGFMAFGTAASGAVSNVTSRVQLLGYAMGPDSPLAMMSGPLMAISTGFRDIATAEQTAETSGRNFIGLSAGLQGIGTILIGLGAAGTAFAAPLQRAQAAYDTAITNTGKNIEDYKGQLNDAEAAGKNFGLTNSDITQALSQLTAETRNPDEAFRELTMTETLAAAAHTSLGSAARQMGQIHAGMYRSLRQFGIQLPQIRNDTAKLGEEEQKLADAGQKVIDSQTRLATYQEEVSQKMAADQERYTQAVTQDQETLQLAQESLAQRRAQYAEQDKARMADLATAVEDSTFRQEQAEQHLADLKQELSDKSSRSILDKMSMSDAEARVNDAQTRVAETSGLQQQAAIGQLRDAKEAYTREQLRQSDQVQTDARNLKDAEHGVTDATTQHNKALQDQADYAETVHQHQLDLAKAEEAVSKANSKLVEDQKKLAESMKPTLEQAAKLATLTEDLQKAQEKQGEQQAKVNDIKDQQKRLDEGFLQAEQQFMEREQGLLKRRENTWTGHVAKIKAGIVDLLQQFGHFAPALLTIGGVVSGIGTIGRIGGALRRGGGTTGETVAGAEAGATAGAEDLSGEVAAPKLVGRNAAGQFVKRGAPGDITGATGEGAAGGAAEAGGVAAEAGGAAAGVGEGAAVAGEVAGVGAAAGEAAGGVGIFAGVIEGLGAVLAAVGSALISVPALIVAAVIAVGVGIFELVTHWDTVMKFLGEIAGDVGRFFERLGRDILSAAEKIPGLLVEGLHGLGRLIIQHFQDSFKELTESLPEAIRETLEWFAHLEPKVLQAIGATIRWLNVKGAELVAGLILGIVQQQVELFKWFLDLGGTLLGLIKDAGKWLWNTGKDILGGLWDGIKKGWEDVVKFFKGFPKTMLDLWTGQLTWLEQRGKDIFTGLWNGIKDVWDDVTGWFKGLPKMMTDFLHTVEGGPLKWLESLGKDIIQGIVNGLTDMIPSINDAAKAVIVDGPKKFVDGLLGRKSPSTVYAEMGRDIMRGLGMGITGNANEPISALSGVNDSMKKITIMPGTASRPATALGGDFQPPTPPAGKQVTQHITQHFHKEISPVHVAHELAWDANQ